MRSDNKGISLIELLIIVILISTVATAYLNFRNGFGKSQGGEPEFSAIDSALYAALDIIAVDLRLAGRGPGNMSHPLTIEHLGKADKIRITRNNLQYEYLVDENGRLIRQTAGHREKLADEIVSLKARELGKETVILTLTTIPKGESPGSNDNILHSYSRVVTVKFPLD